MNHPTRRSGVIALAVATLPLGLSPGIAPAQESASADLEEIVVTARKREESLGDIPIAITAVSVDDMEKRNLRSVGDIAASVPGLNINSDNVGRAFVSIRGIGTALQAGVQPGIGIFQDGVYLPVTSYINNPTLDIERIEVLRGPQGTLYGKNTLGGAINIITRQPTDAFSGRVGITYSDADASREYFGGLSGPIVDGKLRGRIAVSSRRADGFFENKLIGGDVAPTDSDHLSFGLQWLPSDDVSVSLSGYYLDLLGGGSYSHVTGPTAYLDNVRLNALTVADFNYQGANLRVEFPLAALKTQATVILARDERELTSASDGDFLSLDILRSSGTGTDETSTAELRFDTQFSDRFSTLLGFFASRERSDAAATSLLVPLARSSTAFSDRESKNFSIFGTAIWRLSDQYELTAGLRYDDETREQDSFATVSTLPGVIIPDPSRRIDASEVQPRVTLTRFLDNDRMVYASIAKGYRGGGFNATGAPPQFSTYGGDTVWTYEIGSKGTFGERGAFVSGALYYNDYTDFIGQNALTRNAGGALVSIDLNLGDVESYGLEAELVVPVNEQWRVSGALTLMHARITDQRGWLAVSGGNPLATDRLLFQPDWNLSLNSDLRMPLGEGEVNWNVNLSAKGSRPGSSFDPVTPSILEKYVLLNTTLGYRRGPLDISLFATNLTDEGYFESYIDGSLLAALGLLDQNLGVLGAPRNVGVRLQYRF